MTLAEVLDEVEPAEPAATMDCSGSGGSTPPEHGSDRQRPSRRGQIVVRGARTHNLKNVDLTLPTRSLIVMTGVSGSGKSSLAFDTIYAEGQRRYVESLSAYARQFLERMEKPDVDSIEGICPAIAIRQKNSIRNPRSTVGTTTEIHDYLRLLYARVGRTFCRNCGREVIRETAEVVARRLGALPDGTRLLIGFEMPVVTAAPMTPRAGARGRGGDGRGNDGGDEAGAPQPDLPDLVDPDRRDAGGAAPEGLRPPLRRRRRPSRSKTSTPRRCGIAPTLQVIVDRLKIEGDMRARLTDSIETAYTEGGGAAFAIEVADGRGAEARRSPAYVQRAVRVPRVQHPVRAAAAAAVLVQQPVRRLPDLPRLRQHHRARHGPGRPGSVEVASSRTRSSRGASRTTGRSSPSLKRAAQAARPAARRALVAS